MFRMIRYFSVASFLCIVVAAVALTAYFRHIAIREIVAFGESGNVALAQAALNSVKLDLLAFLEQTDGIRPGELSAVPLTPALAHEIDDLLRVKSVARIKIYSRRGLVVYATRAESIGQEQGGNPGFTAALAGQVASKLVYRDAFNIFDSETEEDNLIQTYLPVAGEPGQAPRGVFELYTDINAMVAQTQAAQSQVIFAAILIMGLLYLTLLAVVRYAERIITSQQREIREHTAALERISARLLQTQEEEKRKIAFDLHEGVAQTLAAVKLSVEHAARQLPGAGGGAAALQPMVQTVKEAINEVRSLALNLRPSSLDELGLVATLDWYCREFVQMHPAVKVERHIDVDEARISPPLRIIVYRVVEEACRDASRIPGLSRLRVSLAADADMLALGIDHDGRAPESEPQSGFGAARERTVLSGGSFESGPAPGGGQWVRATWLR